MNAGGWIFLGISWAVIIGLCAATYVLTLGLKVGNMLAVLDIDTEKPVRKKSAKKRNKARR
jgi:hypothetical protein